MATLTHEQLGDFLARHLGQGLTLDQGAREFFLSTFGEEPDASNLCRLVADREEAEAAVFLSLLLEPSEDVKLRLEALLAGQEDDEGFDEEAVADRLLGTCPVIRLKPGGGDDVELVALADEVREFVAKLRLNAPAPSGVAYLVRERFPERLRERALVRLRHAGLAWTRSRVEFLEALARRVDPGLPELAELMDFAASLLGIWPETFDAGRELVKRHEELRALARRAEQQDEMLRKSNFETLAQQGLRVMDLQPQRLARELDYLRLIGQAVLGVDPRSLGPDAPEHDDLGQVQTPEALMEALSGPRAPEGPLPSPFKKPLGN